MDFNIWFWCKLVHCYKEERMGQLSKTIRPEKPWEKTKVSDH